MTIGDGVTVSLFGDNHSFDITGDATINAVLDANGSNGNFGYLSKQLPAIWRRPRGSSGRVLVARRFSP